MEFTRPGPDAPRELYETPHWFACWTRSRAEKVVERAVAGAGIEAYLPLVEEVHQWADRQARVAMPLFPGYVFARFHLTEIHRVLRAPGVVAVASPNGYPTPVREEELDSVRRLVEGAGKAGVFPAPEDPFSPGEPVVVTDGPFRGMKGVLLERRGEVRVAVRLEALRQAVSVVMSRKLLRSVAA